MSSHADDQQRGELAGHKRTAPVSWTEACRVQRPARMSPATEAVRMLWVVAALRPTIAGAQNSSGRSSECRWTSASDAAEEQFDCVVGEAPDQCVVDRLAGGALHQAAGAEQGPPQPDHRR